MYRIGSLIVECKSGMTQSYHFSYYYHRSSEILKPQPNPCPYKPAPQNITYARFDEHAASAEIVRSSRREPVIRDELKIHLCINDKTVETASIHFTTPLP